jgi:hypothetical protein
MRSKLNSVIEMAGADTINMYATEIIKNGIDTRSEK